MRGEQIPTANLLFHACGDFLKVEITDLMAIEIVDLFEIIEVDVDQAEHDRRFDAPVR